jgi:hypothetical protein
VITKSTFGGDCFSNYIHKIKDDQKMIVVELDFLSGKSPLQKSNNTGAWIGYEDGKDFIWTATPLMRYNTTRDDKTLMQV